VDAKPELEIYADDVACAHGNTVGALDEEAMFYARQRGIPWAEARAMLTAAFLAQVVDRIEHEGAREIARAWVEARLNAPSVVLPEGGTPPPPRSGGGTEMIAPPPRGGGGGAARSAVTEGASGR
jgi:hypothetical protein